MVDQYSSISYEKLSSLSDVLLTALANGESVKWDSLQQKWVNYSPSGVLPTDLNISGQTSGDILYFNGTNWVRLAKGTASQVLQTGTPPSWVNPTGLTESSEQNSTPVTDNADQALAAGSKIYSTHFTVPSTYKFIIITGIEWKNGATVSGNLAAGVSIVNATPPTLAAEPIIAATPSTAQSGVSSVQRPTLLYSRPIRAGTVLVGWVMADNVTSTMRVLTAQASQNYNKATTYTGIPPNIETAAWSATTLRGYIKIYYVGYS